MTKTTQGTTSRTRVQHLWTTVRDDLTERRHVSAQRRELQRELATYTTSASVEDLLGTIEGQEGAEVDMIRSILANNLMQQRTHRLVA